MYAVHHLTYERFGNEPLEDLQSVCAECHSVYSAKGVIDPLYKFFILHDSGFDKALTPWNSSGPMVVDTSPGLHLSFRHKIESVNAFLRLKCPGMILCDGIVYILPVIVPDIENMSLQGRIAFLPCRMFKRPGAPHAEGVVVVLHFKMEIYDYFLDCISVSEIERNANMCEYEDLGE